MYMGCKIHNCIKGIAQFLLIAFFLCCLEPLCEQWARCPQRESKNPSSAPYLSPAPLHPDPNLSVTEQFIKVLTEKGCDKGYCGDVVGLCRVRGQ